MTDATLASRAVLRELFDAAVAAAHPDGLLARHLPAPPQGRIVLLGAGKAAGSMIAAAEAHYLDTLGLPAGRLTGLGVARQGYGCATRVVPVIEAGHPVPDQAGVDATARILDLARNAGPDDLVLALLSGGGSANWIAPADGVSFAQKQAMNKSLLRSGAPIGEMNTVRKHLSRIKGGRLARAAAPAKLLTLAISDVPFDDPATIASGPTVPDTTTLADAREIVARYRIKADDAVIAALNDPANESCKPGDAAFANSTFKIIARPQESLDAAVAVARKAGYDVISLGADLEGEARDVAAAHAQIALKAHAEGKKLAILSGGELTVTVRGNGRGGPNQEYVLALASLLADTPGIAVLAGDTDGADGGAGDPTDPAGALLDQRTFAKMRDLKLDPKAYLDNNDATAFFTATGDLLNTGPTLTNVNDIRIILVDP